MLDRFLVWVGAGMVTAAPANAQITSAAAAPPFCGSPTMRAART